MFHRYRAFVCVFHIYSLFLRLSLPHRNTSTFLYCYIHRRAWNEVQLLLSLRRLEQARGMRELQLNISSRYNIHIIYTRL